jgi:hypothetical protein
LFNEHKLEMRSWQDAIKIDPSIQGESPYFRHQLDQRMGDHLGRTINDALILSPSLMQSEDFDNDAGAILDELAPDLGANSEAFKLGFNRRVEQGLATARTQNRTARRNETLVAGQLALADQVQTVLEEDGGVAEIVAALQASILVMDKNTANTTVLNAIGTYALEQNDAALLDIMFEIPTSQGNFLGGTAEAGAVRERYEKAILAKARQEYNDWWTRRGREQTVILDQVIGDVTRLVQENPGIEPNMQPFIDVLNENGMSKYIPQVKAAAQGVVSFNEPLASFNTQVSLAGQVWDPQSPLSHNELQLTFQGGGMSQKDFDYATRLINVRDVPTSGDAMNNALISQNISKAISDAGQEARLREAIPGVPSNPYDSQLQNDAEDMMAKLIARERDTLSQLGELERLERLGELKESVVHYYRREAIRATQGMTAEQQMQYEAVDPIYKDQYAAMERHSHAAVIPQIDVDKAEPIVQALISSREMYGDAAENLGQLIDELPPSVVAYIAANNIQPTSEEFLMILWGQQAFYRVNNNATVPEPVPAVPTTPKIDKLSGGTN